MSGNHVLLVHSRSEDPEGSLLFTDAGGPRGEGRVGGLDQLYEVLSGCMPKTVILDLPLSIRRGMELLRAVRTSCPEAEIVARVRPRSAEPKLFTLRTSGDGFSLEPLGRPGLELERLFSNLYV